MSVLIEARAGKAPADLALPPYVLGLRAEVQRGSARLRTRMLKANRRLNTVIQSESVRIVTQYTKRGRPAPAALARYGEMVASWRNAAAVHRAMAQELVDQTNQLLACYWDAAWQRARRKNEIAAHELDERRPTEWLPGEIALDPTWHRVDDWLITDRWYGQQPSDEAARPAVLQALAILDSQAVGASAASATDRFPDRINQG
ncbi:hypothetical protein [Streptomyces thermovulgaris]|uniref:hypothetical protein n=1 Tax=Streptomyces thermovulgaris TaxID=1934 RepID=UPI001B80362B|nr:hypothetical protein [Streptomyces thermovulgaris]